MKSGCVSCPVLCQSTHEIAGVVAANRVGTGSALEPAPAPAIAGTGSDGPVAVPGWLREARPGAVIRRRIGGAASA